VRAGITYIYGNTLVQLLPAVTLSGRPAPFHERKFAPQENKPTGASI